MTDGVGSRLTPIGLLRSVLYFGVPVAVFSASILGLLPWMMHHGYGGFTIFNVTFGGPLLLLLEATLIAYRREGNRWTWVEFRDRMRLRRPTAKDWLWVVALPHPGLTQHRGGWPRGWGGLAWHRYIELALFSLLPPSGEAVVFTIGTTYEEHPPLPKRNYQFEKRQLDLEKKRKKEEKRQRKLDRAKSRLDETPAQPPAPVDMAPEE